MEKTSSGIRNWPESERPRERLKSAGAESLSDAELLAVLFRNGTRGKDAASLGRELLARFGGLRGVSSASWSELDEIRGLGPAKIATLLAAAEISQRSLREEIFGREVVRDPEAVVNYLIAALKDRKKEVFKVLFLSKANRVLDERDLFHGTIDETLVHPREVVKAALERHATGVILVHNHPSGRTEPSREDVEMTRRIRIACETVSVKVVDHIIIGDNRYFSFSEHGLLS